MSAIEGTLVEADEAVHECATADWPHIEAEVRRRTVADIRARLNARWGHVAPGCVDPAQVQDVLDDVEAGRPPAPHVDPSPDCAARKHAACDGRAWDDAADAPTDCPCRCHTRAVTR